MNQSFIDERKERGSDILRHGKPFFGEQLETKKITTNQTENHKIKVNKTGIEGKRDTGSREGPNK